MRPEYSEQVHQGKILKYISGIVEEAGDYCLFSSIEKTITSSI